MRLGTLTTKGLKGLAPFRRIDHRENTLDLAAKAGR